MKSIWDYEDYKPWLREALTRRGHGSQSALAGAVACQPSYLTKILKGETELSPEQAEATAAFFHLDEEETESLLWLVLRERAGTAALKKRFTKRILEMREKQIDQFRAPPNRNEVETLKKFQREDLVVYYAHWYYAAAHMLMTIPGEHTVESLSRDLQVSKGALQVMLRHLEKMGIIEFKNGSYNVTANEIFLNAVDTTIKKWHLSWRTRLLQVLDTPPMKGDYHHTYLISCTEEDVLQIRKFFDEAIKKTFELARTAKSEKAIVVGIDLMPLIATDREKWGGEDAAPKKMSMG